jgi:hypothetical protein
MMQDPGELVELLSPVPVVCLVLVDLLQLSLNSVSPYGIVVLSIKLHAM